MNFLELAFAAGGKISPTTARKPRSTRPRTSGLKFMVDGIKSGAAPKAVTTTWRSRRGARSSRKGDLHADCPYCYALAEEAPKTKAGRGRPDPRSRAGKAGILGGANLVILTYSKTRRA